MYCSIVQHKREGFTAMPDPEGGPYSFFYDFWVCAACHLPTRMVFEKLTDKRAPRLATHIKSVVGDSAGRNILTWGTPTSGEKIKTMMFHPYPGKVDMDQGRNICLELWQKLDACIDQIRGTQVDNALIEAEKVRATALAEVIALVMQPFYADSTAVLQESMNRWTGRQEGRDHESPGLAEAIWNPSTRFDGTPFTEANEVKARSGNAPKAKVVLDEQKITFIKHTLSTGAMSPEVLAGMFSCTVDDIKAANDS